MGAGALTICHTKAATQVKEDMKRMVQLPMVRNRPQEDNGSKFFGVPLLELLKAGLLQDGVPLVVRRMVEHLRNHGLQQEGIFRVNGNVRAVETLKMQLESDEVDILSEADVCTVASLLKQYLRELPGGLVDSAIQQALIHHHQEVGEDASWSALRELLQQLPDVHYSLLRYLCQFLTQVDHHHKENRMTAFNLATVFGPSVFHVSPGFDVMTDQNICNKIMAKLIQNYSTIFECDGDRHDSSKELPTLIVVKEARATTVDTVKLPSTPTVKTPAPVRRKEAPPYKVDPFNKSSTRNPTAKPRTNKVRSGQGDKVQRAVPPPSHSAGLPHVRPLPIPVLRPLSSELRGASRERLEQTSPPSDLPDISPSKSTETLNSSQGEERPISPFYMSNHLSPVHCRPDVANFLDSTIRSVVEQHLFDVNPLRDPSSEATPRPSEATPRPSEATPRLSEVTPRPSEVTPRPSSPAVLLPNARQRRRQQRGQQETASRPRDRSRAVSLISVNVNKENIPSEGRANASRVRSGEGPERASCQSDPNSRSERTPKPRSRPNPMLLQLTGNQETNTECIDVSETYETAGGNMDTSELRNGGWRTDSLPLIRTLTMKIKESPVTCDTGRAVSGGVHGPESERSGCEDIPRLDLTGLTEDNNWADPPFFNSPFLDFKSIFQLSYSDEPVPAYSSRQRESMDREEARLSPHAGGRLIRQLLEEDSNPMLSPRFYGYGHSQQYLDDTEVPPSPPNAHSFVSRRRSSSLGSCDDEKEELTSAQLSRRIHVLKKKIRRFEEKFEEERKYRPSHIDKVANPEVLRWVNELASLRKDLKEHKLLKSEEDLPPLTRQRSNTLPKSFGSQLEKKPQQESPPKPPVESTLEVVMCKLQEKREEVARPHDIKDMTREQIGAEKLALQKALLYYEGIHGRPVTKTERQVMKPLYDRYRLVKQILCRASTIPVISSPSSKRRCPLLQPIIEGVPALFFDDIKEEEDGSEDDGDARPHSTLTDHPDLSMLGFLDQLEEEADGFISPVDELSPSKNPSDMGLSNLHSATTQELVEQLQETREEKKRIRKNLREFEDQFFRQNGRNVQKEDRSPLAVEYNEYKQVKAKLRLLEVLISKRD